MMKINDTPYGPIFRDAVKFMQSRLPARQTPAYWDETAALATELTETYRNTPQYAFCCAVMEAILYELAGKTPHQRMGVIR